MNDETCKFNQNFHTVIDVPTEQQDWPSNLVKSQSMEQLPQVTGDVGDVNVQNEVLDEPLDGSATASHTVIDVPAEQEDWPSNLVKSQSMEQLPQVPGDVGDVNVQNEVLDEPLDGSTTASHTVIDVPAEQQDWPSNLVKSQSMEQLPQVTGDVGDVNVQNEVLDEPLDGSTTASHTVIVVPAEQEDWPSNLVKSQSMEQLPQVTGDVGDVNVQNEVLDEPLDGSTTASHTVIVVPAEQEDWPSNLVKSQSMEQLPQVPGDVGDVNVQNEVLDEPLDGSTTASHTVIDVPAEQEDWPSNLVKSQSMEQLPQVPGDVGDVNVQNEVLDEPLDGSTTASHTVIDVPAEQEDWPSNLVKSQSMEQLPQVPGDVGDVNVQNEVLDEPLDGSTTASHTVIDVPAEQEDWPSNLVKSQSMEQLPQVPGDVGDVNVQNEVLDEPLDGSATASHTVIDVPAEQEDWPSNLVKSQSMEQLPQVPGDVGDVNVQNEVLDEPLDGSATASHTVIDVPAEQEDWPSNLVKSQSMEQLPQVPGDVGDVNVQNEVLDGPLDGSATASHTVIDVPAEQEDWPSNLVKSQSMEQFPQVARDVEGLAAARQTDTQNVINDDDQQSIADNNNKPPKTKQIVWETTKDPIIVILLLCAVLSLCFGVKKHGSKGWTDGGGIFLAVFVVVAVTAYCKIWPRRQIFSKLGQSHCEMFMSEHAYDANQKTPLERKLHKLAMHIAKVGFVVAFLVLLIHLISYFKGNMQGDDLGIPGKTSTIRHVLFAVIGILVTPIAIASTAIPEGLLLAVIVPVAYSMKRMAVEEKALVRKLAALEEIGSTTVICTNGNGDLMSKNLEVSRFWHGQHTFSSISENVRELLLQGVDSDPGSRTESVGLAIRSWAYQHRADQHTIEGNIEQVTPNATVLHQRGDPEAMLANSYQYDDRHGNIKKITNEVRKILKQNILEMKSKFPQCIGFSCSDKSGEDQEEECFTLIGVAGLTYPCLPEIKDVVNDCQSAGVDVKLVTRSELPAAIAIAHECGILRSNEEPATGLVIDGHDFRCYPEEDRLRISNEIRVLAGASAMDKRCLVQDLKRRGHVVAVTGDSVGDADVLKEANVGLSLGIQGTNIAKENSDVIILNDNFESIATAMRWGRSMYCKIQTFVQFQLTVSISSLTVDFVTAISARELPNINAVATISAGKTPCAALQVLWAKLIVGVLACLAITIEEPAKKLKELPSVKKTEPFMANIMWKNIVGQALYPVIVLLTINFKGESVLKVDPKVKDTMIFNTFVLWQLVSIFKTKRFNGINVIKWIQREKLFWTILISMGCLQVVIVEALGRFAGTKRLNWMEWAECIGLAVLAWPIGWLVQRFISLVP